MKKFYLKVLILLSILFFVSCSITKNSITGKYVLKNPDLEMSTIKLYNGNTFKKTEMFFESKNSINYNGTWKIQQDTLKLLFDENIKYTSEKYDLKNNELLLFGFSEIIYLKVEK